MSGFAPLDTIRIDLAHTLDQLTGRYQSIRDGLPELVKNSKDHYARLGIAHREERQILVIFSENRKHLAVLDFGGAAPEDFEGWVEWSSRTASRAERAHDIEAGHGNGGKAFMVRGCRTYAFMCGHRLGRRTQMGFRNDDPALKYRAGYFRDDHGDLIHDLPDPDVRGRLSQLLRPFTVSIGDLPRAARRAFDQRCSYTLVVVRDVNELTGSSQRAQVIGAAIDDLRGHPQAALTIESSQVWVMRGGEVLAGPLAPEPIAPKPGFETPWVVDVPALLEDPLFGTEVLLPQPPEGRGQLELRSSDRQLRMSERTRPLNVIRVRNLRNVVSRWSVADLAPSASSAFLYGTLTCPGLGAEHVAGADRQTLADIPLTRALRHWTAQQVRAAADEMRRAEAQRESEAGRERANDALRQLRDLMRQFLTEQPGDSGRGTGTGRGPAPRAKAFGHRVDEAVLEEGVAGIAVPVGARIPIRYTCYEVDLETNGRLPVPCPAAVLRAEPPDSIEWSPDGTLVARRPGGAVVWIETRPDIVCSNRIEVTAWDVTSVDLKPPARRLRQGERAKVEAAANTSGGVLVRDLLYETYVEETEMGRFGRSGVFTAGRIPGTATACVRFGASENKVARCSVEIGEEAVPRRGGPEGPDIPMILLCRTPAPGREDWPTDQRTHEGGADHQTIIEGEPVWQGPPEIIWINQWSKESVKVRSGRGPSGVIGLDNNTFFDYLVLKCFEILRRLVVRQDLADDETLGYYDFILRLSEAETRTAPFIDAGFALARRLVQGVEAE